VCVTASHIAVPLRWFTLLPMELIAFFGYGIFAFGVGSPMPLVSMSSNIGLLGTLIFAASLGRRHAELQERSAFLRVVREKSLRVEAEFKLETTSLNRRKPSKCHDDSASIPTTGITNLTGRFFEDLDRLDEEETAARFKEIAELGQTEHWLISPEDVMTHPQQILGFGGFGVVMLASYHGSTIALKDSIARADAELLVPAGKKLVAMANELRMLRRLRHPNIILFYGACMFPDIQDLALVMECVRGIRLDRVALPPPHAPSTAQRCKLADDVCCALLYLHTQKPQLVHGDIKGSNIMVEQSIGGVLNAKLLDFGLGRVLTKKAQPLGGTLVWRAPELLGHERLLPATSADVFSLGRLLYMLATGVQPLAGWEPRRIVAAAIKNVRIYEKWPTAPMAEDFRLLSESCTEIDPSSRPPVDQVKARLRSLSYSPMLLGEKGMPLREGLALARDIVAKKTKVHHQQRQQQQTCQAIVWNVSAASLSSSSSDPTGGIDWHIALAGDIVKNGSAAGVLTELEPGAEVHEPLPNPSRFCSL